MQRENRKLAAIVAADIAGYSRLIGQDEEGTLRALRAHRKELIDRLIEEHRGRIALTLMAVKTALAMVFKLLLSARKKWRRLNGSDHLAEVIQGVRFEDGIKQIQNAA